MKLSFSTLGCPHYDIGQIVDIAVANGYEGVEIRAVKGTVDIMSLDEFKGAGLQETAKKFKDAGLKVVCIGTSIKFCVADKAHQQETLESAKRIMEAARMLDCEYIRTFGGPVPSTQGYLETVKWIRQGHELLCELGRDYDVCPLLETHDDFCASARVLEIINGLSGIGVVWDIANPLCYGETIEDTYAALKGYIKHTHIKDIDTIASRGSEPVLTGEGKVPIAGCLGLLKAGGYSGYLSFEWEKLWHPNIPGPEIALPHYAAYMRELMK